MAVELGKVDQSHARLCAEASSYATARRVNPQRRMPKTLLARLTALSHSLSSRREQGISGRDGVNLSVSQKALRCERVGTQVCAVWPFWALFPGGAYDVLVDALTLY